MKTLHRQPPILSHQPKIRTIALPILCFSLTLFFFAPYSIFLANSYEFTIDVYQLFFCGLALSFLVSIILLLLTLAIPHQSKLQHFVLAFIVSCTFLLFLQGNLILWKYGLLDGSEIHLRDHRLEAIGDTAFWLIVLILTVWKSGRILAIANKLAAILLVIQTVSFFVLLVQSPPNPSFKRYNIDESHKFEFSRNANVVIIVLDSFQTDFFQEILNENTSYSEAFDGFTYFRNSTAGHPFTETSTMNILTGQFYEGAASFENHKRISYSNKSIPKILKSNGFEVDLFPLLKRSLYYDETVLSNIKRGRTPRRKLIEEFTQLIDLSFFRYFPTILKFRVYSNGDWLLARIVREYRSKFIERPARKTITDTGRHLSPEALKQSDSLHFLNQMISKANAGRKTGVFKFYHLDLPHLPLRINELLEYERMPVTRHNYKRQSIAALKIVQYTLEHLKKIGAYDNSLILIIADHGAGAQDQKFLDTVGFPVPQDEEVISELKMINAAPLFLAKQFNSSGVLKISDAPVSLSDIPATVFSELGIPTNAEGVSVFKVEETKQRIRRYIFYEKYDPFSDYYESMQEWLINGKVWLLSSWQPSHRTFTRNGPILNIPKTYKLGTIVRFDNLISAREYQTYGWSQDAGPRTGFCWTVGSNAALSFPVNVPDTHLLLTIHALPYLPQGKRTGQRVLVKVNKTDAGEWNIFQKGIYRLIISKEWIRQNRLNIAFELPDAISPYEAEGISDDRKLGVGVESIRLQGISNYALGTILDFRLKGKAKSYAVSGWSKPSSQFTWTASKTATMNIPMPPIKNNLVLTANMIPYLGNRTLEHQRVELLVNDQEITIWNVKNAGEYRAVIPLEKISGSTMLRIRFVLPDAVSPKKLEGTADNRDLGVAFVNMKIEEASNLNQ